MGIKKEKERYQHEKRDKKSSCSSLHDRIIDSRRKYLRICPVPDSDRGQFRSGAECRRTGGERETTAPEKIRIWGTVTSVEENRIVLNNQSGASFEGEMVLHISDETTKVLGAVDGLPLSLSDIHVGDSVYAYIGPAMTLSLPPQTAAEMIIAGIPADFKVPEYITVDSMTWNEDTSWTLVSSEGTTYQIPGECPVIPYLTRQMVYLPDVTEGRELLIWSNAENVGQKLILFNE